MVFFKKNLMKFFIILSFITILILFFYYVLKSFSYKVNIVSNYDNDPNNFIEPKVYENIITSDEAKYILEKSKNDFEDSYILGGFDTSIRKSKTCWLKKDDDVIKKIIKRICNIGNYKIENAEDLQVVKYEPNGYYNEHHDSCCDDSTECKDFLKRGGNRVLTMVIYLNDNFEGGATRFINLDKDIKPNKYSGILFFPMNKNGDKCHTNSLHAGLPIKSGEKYIANVWIRESNFE
jgi:prolyl 4-hydroxylase